MTAATDKPKINAALGLEVNKLEPDAPYNVSGYHTGDFTGVFVRTLGMYGGAWGEFRITYHRDPEMIGRCVEIPHHLARIEHLNMHTGVAE